MNIERLALKCRVCKKVQERKEIKQNDSEIVAYGDIMEWAHINQIAPDIDVEAWFRSEEPPIKGELRTVQVQFPFNMSIGETFWTLFQPVLSMLNGWDDHPEEIDTSAIVKCKFNSILSKNEEKAWITVIVEDVLFLKDICDKMPEKDGTGSLSDFKMFGDPYIFTYKDWMYLAAGAQGDIGVWALVKKLEHKSVMVAYGDWSFHYDWVYCGNTVLPEHELNEIIELSET